MGPLGPCFINIHLTPYLTIYNLFCLLRQLVTESSPPHQRYHFLVLVVLFVVVVVMVMVDVVVVVVVVVEVVVVLKVVIVVVYVVVVVVEASVFTEGCNELGSVVVIDIVVGECLVAQ